MVGNVMLAIILAVYATCAFGLCLYGVNCYYMIYLFVKNRRKQRSEGAEYIKGYWERTTDEDLPVVTTQIPIFNEKYVAERVIRKVIAFDWPKAKHEIQILDDSTDETLEISRRLAEEYRAQGYDITLVQRSNREGYKAGALDYGMKRSRGEFIAIFDADFLPEPDFLRQTVPFFYERDDIGLVQTRWGHVNRDYSLLTIAQSIGIDGHFVMEQSARCWGGLFMNFNGTAGIWRRTAIDAAGGWEGDTLTEDLDLSYRAQLKGWDTKYLYEVICPAEVPADVNAFKSQQHRWAKGSMQVAKKILPRVFRSKEVPLRRKFEAFLHLTHYGIHPLMVTMAILSVPIVLTVKFSVAFYVFIMLLVFLLLSTFGPSSMYVTSQRIAYRDGLKRCFFIPALMCIGTGIAINNARAVLEALFGIKSGFVRTPKLGLDKKRKPGPSGGSKKYTMPLRFIFLFEILLGLYCFYGFLLYTEHCRFMVGPFLLIYAAGFTYIGMLSVLQSFKSRKLAA